MYRGNECQIGDEGAKYVTSIRFMGSRISMGRKYFQMGNRPSRDCLNVFYTAHLFHVQFFHSISHTNHGKHFC